MKNSTVLVAAAFLWLISLPTSTVGRQAYFPKRIRGWPNPSEITNNDAFFSAVHRFNYGDFKVWKCTYSNGSNPAISISPSIPLTPTPSTPSTPSPSPSPLHPAPKTSPPPPTPKKITPPPTPSPPHSVPNKSPPPPTPSLPPPTPKKSPSPPPPTSKKSPSPPSASPSVPHPTPKKSPSPSPPSNDHPSNPPPKHHAQNPWEHIGSCMRNMEHAMACRAQMEISFFTRLFQVSSNCCDFIVNMKSECDDVIWGFFTDPFFVPLVRCTCHVTY